MDFHRLLTSLGLLMVVLSISGASGSSSTGCSGGSPLAAAGQTIDLTRSHEGQSVTHKLSMPPDYDNSRPAPLILFFHGWTQDSSYCGDICSSFAPQHGFITLAMQGHGPSTLRNWAVSGGQGTGPLGPTCDSSISTGYCQNLPSCTCSGATACWWTSCDDSVAKVVAILDELQASLCIDLNNIWAVGYSNGAMFSFELAYDSRTAPRLAGVGILAGLPHYGFNRGPSVNMSFFGMFGLQDPWFPVTSHGDANHPDRTLDTESGYYYYTPDAVLNQWEASTGCTEKAPVTEWGISNYNILSNCNRCAGPGVQIASCNFNAGHEGYQEYEWIPMLNFMRNMSGMPEISVSWTGESQSSSREGGSSKAAWKPLQLGFWAAGLMASWI